jgi:maltooligosyltrehalose synthase
MHGYDVVDPQRVNPELGGEEALRSLVPGLRGAGMGLIADIVPNHMAAAARELLLSLLAPNDRPALLSEFAAFVGRIAAAGAVNSLAQTLLKLTVPGVPDTYQGTELLGLQPGRPGQPTAGRLLAARKAAFRRYRHTGIELARRPDQAGVDCACSRGSAQAA